MSFDTKKKIFFSSVVTSNATFITTRVPHQTQNKPINLFTLNTSVNNHPKSKSSNNTISSNSNIDSPHRKQNIIFNSINLGNEEENKDQNEKSEQKFRFRKVFHIQKTKNNNLKQGNENQNEKRIFNTTTNVNPPQFTTVIPPQPQTPTSSSNNEPSKIFYINKKTKRPQTKPKLQDIPEPKPIVENFVVAPSSLGNIKITNPKNDVYIDELREKIQNTYNNQNALDLRMIKMYHQLLMEQQQQIYITPDNSSDEEEDSTSSMKKYKIIMGFSKKVHCNCKKSNCLKNYCECKRNHERCDKKCECEQCKNLSKNN